MSSVEPLKNLNAKHLRTILRRAPHSSFFASEASLRAERVIRRFVMQRAKELLAGSTPIGQVAEQLGFDYPQHFTRQFKSHFGITPTQFIKGRK